MKVARITTGEVVAELSDDWKVTKGKLKLPETMPLQMSRQAGNLIEELAVPVGPTHPSYQGALNDWLLLKGLEL